MSNFELIMNQTDIFEDNETLKEIITKCYFTTKTEYEMNKTANTSTDQLKYCKSLMLCLKMYCCIFKNNYEGYSKYKKKYTDFENEKINDMLFNETLDENSILIFRDDVNQTTTRITGHSEQVRIYAENVKDTIDNVELFSKLLFGKI
jgi:hypothetical protein